MKKISVEDLIRAEKKFIEAEMDFRNKLELFWLSGFNTLKVPGRGEMTIMVRNGRYFWRVKPIGPRPDQLTHGRKKNENQRQRKV